MQKRTSSNVDVIVLEIFGNTKVMTKIVDTIFQKNISETAIF